MSKKKFFILLLLSFLATLLVFNSVRKMLMGNKKKAKQEVPTEVYYAEHIAPILTNHCIKCHRPNGAAPFALTNYNEVFRKKKTIKKVVEQNIMPPWPADPNYTHFLDENVLSNQEKQLIYTWIEQGAREGDVKKMPEIPQFSDVSFLGKPDLTVYMDSFLVKGDNLDKFFVVKTPIEIPRDTYVRAIEFVPNKNQLVHHLNGYLYNYDFDKKNNVNDGIRIADEELHPEERMAEMALLKIHNDDGSMPEVVKSAVNYLPGVFGTIYPEGIGGFKLNRKAVLVANDLHYAPVQKDLWDYSHYNIFYSKTPPGRPTKEITLGSNGAAPVYPQLIIPPDTVMTFTTQFRVAADISILTINPHMHLLGKHFLAYAITPQKDTIKLIRINRWDFRWQYFYTFPTMVKIPAQSVIKVEATFDNTIANKNNPNNPPKTVKARFDLDGIGMRTTDEMFQFIITYLDYKKGDEAVSLKVE
ncbi:MAG: hypothetical protein H6607_06860 [Flavobacteriales bacterium]|nr:hypothetical protein [Flavobacteriales bacterium]